MLKFVLLGFVVLYVAWTIFKAIMNWIDSRMTSKR